MSDIKEFFNDVGGKDKKELAGGFVELMAGSAPDKDEVLDFFKKNNYDGVGMEDVDRLMKHRNNLKNEVGIDPNADY